MRARTGPFQWGDLVQLTGPRGALSTMVLHPGGGFHSHKGSVKHEEFIGKPEGSVFEMGGSWLAQRPLLADYVMSMPRGAAIIYPKDAAQIIALADVGPGDRVVEAGVGSGALTLWLLRALGDTGALLSVERREEFQHIAEANVRGWFGETPNWRCVLGDLQEQLASEVAPGTVDRVILDMLAPWECLDDVAEALRPGGVLVVYIATATQLSRVTEAIRHTGAFTLPAASETLVRGWHVDGLAVRPDHRMVAHTGFLLVARRLAPGATPLEPYRRGNRTEFSDEDVEAWTPGAVGDRLPSAKRLRRAARDAQAQAERITTNLSRAPRGAVDAAADNVADDAQDGASLGDASSQ